MPYVVVRVQDWIISTPDNQPAKGYRVTFTETQTGDTFSLDLPSTDEATVKAAAEAEIARRRRLADLTLD